MWLLDYYTIPSCVPIGSRILYSDLCTMDDKQILQCVGSSEPWPHFYLDGFGRCQYSTHNVVFVIEWVIGELKILPVESRKLIEILTDRFSTSCRLKD